MAKKSKSKKHLFKNILIYSLLFISCLVLVLTLVWAYLVSRVYPGIFVAGVNLSAKNQLESQNALQKTINSRLNSSLVFTYTASGSAQPQQFEIPDPKSLFDLDINYSLKQAFEFGHQKFYFSQKNLPLILNFNQNFDKQISQISQGINQPPIDSSLKVESDQIIVTPSQNGLAVDEEELKKRLTKFVNTGVLDSSTLPVKTVYPKLSYDSAIKIRDRLNEIKLQPLKLTYKDSEFTLGLAKILDLIDLQNSESSLAQATIFGQKVNISSANLSGQELSDTQLTLNKSKVRAYLQELSAQINQDVQEPLFSIEPGSDPQKPKIKEFKPPVQGQQLLLDESYQRLTSALLTPNQKEVKLAVATTSPKNKLTNDLGIKEVIGRGDSDFGGSIENRIYNVGLAASRINGVLISPGETFSFDQTIGDVTAATGYKQAYVIKSGRTVLDDGGGVCQVSTTLFRAILNAGLPVIERTAHAYRVHYYEEGGYPPGLDATIFYPTVDLKFKNDTDHSILIQSQIEGLHLTVNLFGTSDGRVATISKPVILSQTPPPPDIKQDDPTLPKGQVKQVDFSAWGANVVFTRTVTKNGAPIINETFRSNFRPWQAIYLVGTKEG